MDPLTLFGLFAVTLMLITYALEDRSPWFILAFAAACALASVYGFCKAHGPLGSLKPYSQELRFGDGELARRKRGIGLRPPLVEEGSPPLEMMVRVWERLQSLFGFSHPPQTGPGESARPTAVPKKGDVKVVRLNAASKMALSTLRRR